MKRDELIALITKASNPKPVKVDAEGLGTVYARVMTAYDADAMRKKLETLPKDDGCQIGRLLAFVLCDESGALLFNAEDQESAMMLSRLPQNAQGAILRAGSDANMGKA